MIFLYYYYCYIIEIRNVAVSLKMKDTNNKVQTQTLYNTLNNNVGIKILYSVHNRIMKIETQYFEDDTLIFSHHLNKIESYDVENDCKCNCEYLKIRDKFDDKHSLNYKRRKTVCVPYCPNIICILEEHYIYYSVYVITGINMLDTFRTTLVLRINVT